MSTQQSVGTKWYGWNQAANLARVRGNFDQTEKTYPLDIPSTAVAGVWTWPIADVALINTLAYDSVVPSAIL